MGKNKSQKKNAATDFFSDDDTLSTISSGSSSELGGREDEFDPEAFLPSLVDLLFEKRAVLREAALKDLLMAFTSNVIIDFVDQNYETLLHRYLNSIKKGSSTEKALAARALCLQALTAGSGRIADQMMVESWPYLVKAAKSDPSPSTRVAVIETMGILPFVADVELEVTENSMDTLWQICSHKGNHHSEQETGINKPSGPVKSAAISAWTLLLSTIPPTRIASHYVTLSLPTLANLLEVDDSAVRKAAGEAISLIYDAVADYGEHYTIQTHDDISDHPALAESKTQITPKLVVAGGKSLEGVEVKIVSQMRSLSVQAGGKSQSRTDRYSERMTFKELKSNVEDGECRQTIVKLPDGGYLQINDWTHTVQLNALRHTLGGGFQCHLQDNEFLHAVFGHNLNLAKSMSKKEKLSIRREFASKKEKRLYMSPNSVLNKARTKTRNKDRSEVELGNAGFYNVNFVDL